MPSFRTTCVALLAGLLTAVAVAHGQQVEQAATARAALTANGLTLVDVLQAALEKNPQLKIQQFTVDAQAGAAQTAKGQFDWTINANALQQRTYNPLTANQIASYNPPGLGLPYTDAAIANNSTVSATAVKEFRNGIQLTPGVQSTRTTDNLNIPYGLSNTRPSLQIALPLLRNRGRKSVDAQEIAADKQLAATRMDLSQTVSDTLATAAVRYWSFAAADATVVLYKAAEGRAQDFLSNSQALVQADRMPANDLNQARANLANRVASRVAAEQNLLQTRQQLVLVMGLGADKIVGLPGPAEDIPGAIATFDPTLLDGYMKMANTLRADVLAAQLRVDANAALQAQAQNQVKPQLDVTGSIGYTTLREGTAGLDYPRSLVTAPLGPDFTIGLNYSQSPANNAAKGRLGTALALTRQSVVTLSETKRSAAASVVVVFLGVQSALTQLKKAHEAVVNYQAALDGEREKYRLRLNSLIDVLTVEDRLTSVVIDEVNARLAYATALAQLRQATGTIVQAGQDVQQVDPLLFAQLPPAGAGANGSTQ